MSNNSNSNNNNANLGSGTNNSLSAQLAERRQRLIKQREDRLQRQAQTQAQAQAQAQPKEVDELKAERRADRFQGLSDEQIARQLQAEFDREQANRPDSDDDSPMASPPQQVVVEPDPCTPSNIDKDHEIALRLQREFDRESSLSSSPQSAFSNSQASHPPYNNSLTSHSTSTFTYTSQAPDGSIRTVSSSHVPSNMATLLCGLGMEGLHLLSQQSAHQDQRQQQLRSMQQQHQWQQQQQQQPQQQRQQRQQAQWQQPPAASRPQNVPWHDPFNFSSDPFFTGNRRLGGGVNFSSPLATDSHFGNFFGPIGIDLSQLVLQNRPHRPVVANQQDIEQNTATEKFHVRKKHTEASAQHECKQAHPEDDEPNHKQQCAICMEPFKENEEVRRLPCMHIFHKPEIDRWLKTGNDKCPICRASIHQQQ